MLEKPMSIPPRSRPKTFALADLTAKAMDPVLAKQGFGAADIVLNWEEIVGERLARVCEPIKLQWPTRAPKAEPGDVEPASLIVRVESGFAVELQHVGATIIERVNTHLGWRCVGKLLLRQGPVGKMKKPTRAKPAPDPVARQMAAEEAATIQDEGLRDALTRLGERVLAEKRAKSGM
ncbi:MAG: hypothetical protein RIQ68_1392 [Pseudomonadota bacterium]|jgi:hypothetical protein